MYSILAEHLSIDKTVHPVKLGGEVEIECVVKIEKPILEAYWKKTRGKSDTQQIKEKAEKYSIRSTKSSVSLTIKKVEENDEGTYRCIVSYVDGKRIASNATVLKLKVKDGKLILLVVLLLMSVKATLFLNN